LATILSKLFFVIPDKGYQQTVLMDELGLARLAIEFLKPPISSILKSVTMIYAQVVSDLN
jgi:hypothetical protein